MQCLMIFIEVSGKNIKNFTFLLFVNLFENNKKICVFVDNLVILTNLLTYMLVNIKLPS